MPIEYPSLLPLEIRNLATRRKHSREIFRSRLAAREDIERQISAYISQALKEHDPTLHAPGIRTAANLAAVVASQIAVQPQSVQRSLSVLDDHLVELATDFVANLIDSAKVGLHHGIKKFAPTNATGADGVALADDWAGPVAGPTLIERHFGINRSTLHRWHKRGKCVALNAKTSKKPVFPLKQFLDGRPVDGLSDVIAAFETHRDAWLWMMSPQEKLGGLTPVNLLLEGRRDRVISLL